MSIVCASCVCLASDAVNVSNVDDVRPAFHPEREVRFAVVLYGGVSLAIYINGVGVASHRRLLALMLAAVVVAVNRSVPAHLAEGLAVVRQQRRR